MLLAKKKGLCHHYDKKTLTHEVLSHLLSRSAQSPVRYPLK